MFYMKDNLNNIVEITGDFYSRCPECGKLFPVDIVELARQDEDFDLYSTQVFCADCSAKRMNNENSEEAEELA